MTDLSIATRARALNRDEVSAKYPDVSPFVILKMDVQRRSVRYTPAALALVDPAVHLVQINTIFGSTASDQKDYFPISLLLRDGTTIIAVPWPNDPDPYVVDVIDGKPWLTDAGVPIEEVEYWYKPDFADKLTRSGKPMGQIAGMVRPQRLDFNPYAACHFWDNGKGCRYCNVGAIYNQAKKKAGGTLNPRVDPRDVSDTVREAIRQPGRFVNIYLTGGSIPGPDNRFEAELEGYIELLQAIGENFSTRRFPSQLTSSAFDENQLLRLREETGLLSYTTDIEVLDEEKFNWICPGKAERLGFKEWKRRLVAAVEIFGRGYVNTGIVGGVELATPHGFTTEDDALAATLEGAEELASQGVGTVATLFRPYPSSVFHKQPIPSLEYFVRLARGLDAARRRHGLNMDMDNYRRCGNHGDSDLSRI